MTNLHLFFDGGVRKVYSPGTKLIIGRIGAGAAVAYDGAKEVLARARFFSGLDLTSNVLEYEGLLLAMSMARHLGARHVEIYGDSELVVRQVRGEYRTNHDHLRALRDRAWEGAVHFESIVVRECPKGRKGKRRDNNERADELCNRAMDGRCHLHCDQVDLASTS